MSRSNGVVTPWSTFPSSRTSGNTVHTAAQRENSTSDGVCDSNSDLPPAPVEVNENHSTCYIFPLHHGSQFNQRAASIREEMDKYVPVAKLTRAIDKNGLPCCNASPELAPSLSSSSAGPAIMDLSQQVCPVDVEAKSDTDHHAGDSQGGLLIIS